MTHKVMIAGAGKIGSLISCLLAESGDYQITVADKQFNGADISRLRDRFPKLQIVEVDVQNHEALTKAVKAHEVKTVISSLPYYCNISVAKVAKECNLNYFDLTEDVHVTQTVAGLAKDATTAFVPQCGLAPGFVNIAAHSLMQHFDVVDDARLRVGALPQHPSNSLHYSLTWSTDGLINEYGNPCLAIENGKEVTVPPLAGLETVKIDGLHYEAFNTSGGLGSLSQTYAGKIRNLHYKTLRYPGHCEKMRLLMNDLRLNEDRETLKRILEHAIPKTYQDVVVIAILVIGKQNGQLLEEHYVKKVYPVHIAGIDWSAIQITTASGICVVVDLVLNSQQPYRGLVMQEQFTLNDVVNNQFGKCYK